MKRYYGSLGSSDGVVATPEWFKDRLAEAFGEFHDPCPLDPQVDGLVAPFSYERLNYVNPPYARGHIGQWVKKCALEAAKGARIAMLIPAYTDTSYFQDYIFQKAPIDFYRVDVIFMRGRMKFVNADTGERFKAALPQPLVLVLFNVKAPTDNNLDDARG